MAKQLELTEEDIKRETQEELQAMKDNPRMEIWREVCHTNPKFTKKVDMRGGFTAINPHSQLREATQLWGPYGGQWGLAHLQWTMHPYPPEKPSLSLMADFLYPGGSFPIAVDMPFKSNDDCMKKLLTEARSKALALLGFNADIFLGQWEDSMYVAAMQNKFGDQDELRTRAIKAIAGIEDQAGYEKCGKHIDGLFSTTAINKTLHNELWELMDKKKMELVDNGQL